jgi:hypothetical protein
VCVVVNLTKMKLAHRNEYMNEPPESRPGKVKVAFENAGPGWLFSGMKEHWFVFLCKV